MGVALTTTTTTMGGAAARHRPTRTWGVTRRATLRAGPATRTARCGGGKGTAAGGDSVDNAACLFLAGGEGGVGGRGEERRRGGGTTAGRRMGETKRGQRRFRSFLWGGGEMRRATDGVGLSWRQAYNKLPVHPPSLAPRFLIQRRSWCSIVSSSLFVALGRGAPAQRVCGSSRNSAPPARPHSSCIKCPEKLTSR